MLFMSLLSLSLGFAEPRAGGDLVEPPEERDDAENFPEPLEL